MKKLYLKKLLCIISSVSILSVNLLSNSISAAEFEYSNSIETVYQYSQSVLSNTDFDSQEVYGKAAIEIEILFQDEQFNYICLSDEDNAKHIIEEVIAQAINDCNLNNSISPLSYYQGVYYINNSVPVFKQSESYYCGPAATIMAQIGNGDIQDTPTNYSKDAQDDMSDALETTASEGTYVYKISNYMRDNTEKKNSNDDTYGYRYLGDIYNDNSNSINNSGYDFINRIKGSLQSNYVPILYSIWYSAFDYYNGYDSGSGHYLVVTQVDEIHHTVTVVDPHYSNSYNGIHVLTYDNFVCGMDYGYLIYV